MVNDDDNDYQIQVRPSMKKFNSEFDSCLYICDDGYSGARLGFLIRQFLMLLSGLNIDDDVFLRKQDEFFREIETMLTDMNVGLKYCLYYNRLDLVHHLLSNNLQEIQSDLKEFQRKSLDGIEKLKIPITKSRLAFGVCDPCKYLRGFLLDQVFISMTFSDVIFDDSEQRKWIYSL